MRAFLVAGTLIAALIAVSAAFGGATACQKQCFVEIEPTRFKAVGAGASGSTLTLYVGANVKWRMRGSTAHSVVSSAGLFTFGAVGGTLDLSFTITPSAGSYDYRDTVGGAGRGLLVVLPRFTRLGGAYAVTWAAPGEVPPDRVHDVRWLVVQGAEVVGSGTWQSAGTAGFRVFRRNERLKSALALAHGRSLCVEVRTGRGAPRRWSDWANACIQL